MVSGVMAAKILQEFRQPEQSMAQPAEARDELTPREIEVLERVVTGEAIGTLVYAKE